MLTEIETTQKIKHNCITKYTAVFTLQTQSPATMSAAVGSGNYRFPVGLCELIASLASLVLSKRDIFLSLHNLFNNSKHLQTL